ncbi:HAD family hydrolase [Vibrio mexicanus]|uniref:HAD family hydrolase n=1 Tax=Vibrio mexicanus TaxID=1004326 RepID=UPI000A82BE9B
MDKLIADIKAVVFDLDNTLVSSDMDFQALRQQMGCPPQYDLLTFIDEIDCPIQTQAAHQQVIDHEMSDAKSSEPMPGCIEFLKYLCQENLQTAIVTRNCEPATALKLEHNNITIEHVISREHYPPKPDPTSLLALAEQWDYPCKHILYVGDYIYDLQAADNAGMPSCLMTHGRDLDFADMATIALPHLTDLHQLFIRHFNN